MTFLSLAQSLRTFLTSLLSFLFMPKIHEYPLIAPNAITGATRLVLDGPTQTNGITLDLLKGWLDKNGTWRGTWSGTKAYNAGDIVRYSNKGIYFVVTAVPAYPEGFIAVFPDEDNRFVSAESDRQLDAVTYSGDSTFIVSTNWIGDRRYNRVTPNGEDDAVIYIPIENPTPVSGSDWKPGDVLNLRNASLTSSTMHILPNPDSGVVINAVLTTVEPHCNASLVYLGSNVWDMIR